MGFFSRSESRTNTPQNMTDEQAVERYRYMLRTAPPDAIEQAHEEAFARLTPEQRRLALDQLASVASPAEQRQASDDPGSLARLATRAEIRQPGILERVFGSVRTSAAGGGGMGFGGMLAGSLLGSVAGTVLGSAIAHSFFDAHPFQGAGGEGFFGDTFADTEPVEAADGGEGDAFGLDDGIDDFGGGLDDI